MVDTKKYLANWAMIRKRAEIGQWEKTKVQDDDGTAVATVRDECFTTKGENVARGQIALFAWSARRAHYALGVWSVTGTGNWRLLSRDTLSPDANLLVLSRRPMIGAGPEWYEGYVMGL